jgi:predicted alpha/beta superfamily hydrolase
VLKIRSAVVPCSPADGPIADEKRRRPMKAAAKIRRLIRWCAVALFAVVVVGGSAAVPACADSLRVAPLGDASIAGSQTWSMRSEINGVEYQLFVLLPKGYQKSGQRYPVLYLTDGNSNWPIAYPAAERLTNGGEVPPFIVVCIGYVGASQRAVDYPTVAESYWSVPKDRGAPVFLRVLTEEVIPFVDRTFRTDTTDRGLGGHSLGGFFTLYTLVMSPDAFQRYWISSPSIAWDGGVIFRLEESYARGRKDINARVFADIGDLEAGNFLSDLRRMESTFASRGYPHLKWSTDIERDVTHAGVPLAAFGKAVNVLYGREVVSLPPARLAELAGTYQLPDKTTFRLVSDGENLYLHDWRSKDAEIRPAVDHLRLLAESPQSLYSRYVGLNFSVSTEEPGAPSHLIVRHLTGTDAARPGGQPTANTAGALTAVRVP